VPKPNQDALRDGLGWSVDVLWVAGCCLAPLLPPPRQQPATHKRSLLFVNRSLSGLFIRLASTSFSPSSSCCLCLCWCWCCRHALLIERETHTDTHVDREKHTDKHYKEVWAAELSDYWLQNHYCTEIEWWIGLFCVLRVSFVCQWEYSDDGLLDRYCTEM